jgi:putative chitinase
MRQFFEIVKPLFHGRLSQEQVDGLNLLLRSTTGMHTTQRAYLLATAYHETAATMQPIHERGQQHYFDKYEPHTKIGKNLGNTQVGDGFRYRGRGYVQLTGRANYVKAGKALGLDLVAKPDLALDPVVAATVLVRGCGNGWFTGKKLADYLPGDYVGARRVVNGQDKAALIARYAQIFEEALAHAEAETETGMKPKRKTWIDTLLTLLKGK